MERERIPVRSEEPAPLTTLDDGTPDGAIDPNEMYGNVRDTVELRESGLAVCSRGITPRGPMWTGHIGTPIECGGVGLRLGDLIVGDDDGVVAVPIDEVDDALLARCDARIAREGKE